MRIALVVLLVLAVVLPTALVPRTAAADRRVFSAGQVQQSFAAEGLPLHLAAADQQTSGRTTFSGPRGLSVIVFDPAAQRLYAIGWTAEPPKSSGAGNVVAIWPPSTNGETTRVRGALNWLGTLPPL